MSTYRSPAPGRNLQRLFSGFRHLQRGSAFGWMILGALIAFEIFNYSTTDFALTDVLGDLRFAGIRWATILSLAFCGIDFAGVARLFTPQTGRDEPAEIWYLFGAWLLAAAMNATLTWWGVSVAIASHQSAGSAVIPAATLGKAVPIFVAIMVWVIRILIIGTFAAAGDRLLHPEPAHNRPSTYGDQRSRQQPIPGLTRASAIRPAPKPVRPEPAYGRPEPTYHNMADSSRSSRQMSFADRARDERTGYDS